MADHEKKGQPKAGENPQPVNEKARMEQELNRALPEKLNGSFARLTNVFNEWKYVRTEEYKQAFREIFGDVFVSINQLARYVNRRNSNEDPRIPNKKDPEIEASHKALADLRRTLPAVLTGETDGVPNIVRIATLYNPENVEAMLDSVSALNDSLGLGLKPEQLAALKDKAKQAHAELEEQKRAEEARELEREIDRRWTDTISGYMDEARTPENPEEKKEWFFRAVATHRYYEQLKQTGADRQVVRPQNGDELAKSEWAKRLDDAAIDALIDECGKDTARISERLVEMERVLAYENNPLPPQEQALNRALPENPDSPFHKMANILNGWAGIQSGEQKQAFELIFGDVFKNVSRLSDYIERRSYNKDPNHPVKREQNIEASHKALEDLRRTLPAALNGETGRGLNIDIIATLYDPESVNALLDSVKALNDSLGLGMEPNRIKDLKMTAGTTQIALREQERKEQSQKQEWAIEQKWTDHIDRQIEDARAAEKAEEKKEKLFGAVATFRYYENLKQTGGDRQEVKPQSGDELAKAEWAQQLDGAAIDALIDECYKNPAMLSERMKEMALEYEQAKNAPAPEEVPEEPEPKEAPEPPTEDKGLTQQEIDALGVEDTADRLRSGLINITYDLDVELPPEIGELVESAKRALLSADAQTGKDDFEEGMQLLEQALSREVNGKKLLDLALEKKAVKPDFPMLIARGRKLADGLKREKNAPEVEEAENGEIKAENEIKTTVAGEAVNEALEAEQSADGIEKEPELNLGNKNAKQYIEDLQAEMQNTPAPSRDDPGKAEYQKWYQTTIAMRIFAARIGVDAVSGSRGGRSLNVNRNYETEGSAMLAMANNGPMQNWLGSMPYGKLRKLILTGHGGEMEKEFRSYLLAQPEIPGNMPSRFLPTAKARCESLQAQIKAARKAGRQGQELEIKLCKELIVTRYAVGAQRGGEGLKNRIRQEDLERARNEVEADEALQEAIRGAVKGTDPASRAARNLVLSGHGGEFLNRMEARSAALSAEKKPDAPQVNQTTGPKAGG